MWPPRAQLNCEDKTKHTGNAGQQLNAAYEIYLKFLKYQIKFKSSIVYTISINVSMKRLGRQRSGAADGDPVGPPAADPADSEITHSRAETALLNPAERRSQGAPVAVDERRSGHRGVPEELATFVGSARSGSAGGRCKPDPRRRQRSRPRTLAATWSRPTLTPPGGYIWIQ
eukprot:SAG22_NODE_856_length_6839_cov_3.284570_9_plen_172_part_00